MIRTILAYYIPTVFRNLLDFYFSLVKKKAVIRKKKKKNLFERDEEMVNQRSKETLRQYNLEKRKDPTGRTLFSLLELP